LREEDRSNQIGKKVGHNKQINGELGIIFRILKVINQSFFYNPMRCLLCTTNLNISYKNNPYFLTRWMT